MSEPVASVPLGRAVLCEDCLQITAATNGHCPVCGSTAIANLEKLLNREQFPLDITTVKPV